MSPSPDEPVLVPATLTVPMVRLRHPAVGRNRIYAAILTGALPAVRVGKRLAIGVPEVDDWVARGCPTAQGAHLRDTP